MDFVDETHGFKYFDERDLLGFVDGTENPVGPAASAAVLVGDEDPAFAGGSYVMVQKYVHDLTAWNDLTVEQQEAAVGRTKLDNVELADKPANSHVALNTVEGPDGTELKIPGLLHGPDRLAVLRADRRLLDALPPAPQEPR